MNLRPNTFVGFCMWVSGTAAAAAMALKFQRWTETGLWSYFAFCIVAALVLYIAHNAALYSFLNRNGGIDTSEVSPGVQAWELTAGSGIVPKWVSLIGLAAAWFVLALPFFLIASLTR